MKPQNGYLFYVVLDEEDSEITTGSTITVTVRLKRSNICLHMSNDDKIIEKKFDDETIDDVPEDVGSVVSMVFYK